MPVRLISQLLMQIRLIQLYKRDYIYDYMYSVTRRCPQGVALGTRFGHQKSRQQMPPAFLNLFLRFKRLSFLHK